MEIYQYIISILSGLAVTIPLIIKLVEYVSAAVKEKNWQNLVKLVMEYMKAAEERFETGAERKEWVMSMIKASANTINYDVDYEVVSEMIDGLCDMTKVVNASK